MAELVLEDLSYQYPGAAEPTLRNLDLTIASGEAHALLGSSGAGKSTLLNMLSGLLPADAGQLLLNGSDLAQKDAADRGVTQVFQFPVLYEAMDVLGNLSFPLRTAGMSRRDSRSRARDIAEHLEIDHLLGRRPARLSLFEKQLVAIGKALVRPDVSLVLLDEPLTAAEPARKWRLRRTLKMLQRESAATMIYVTHDQTEALTFADRISVMYQGGILQTGSPEQLLNQPAHEHVGYFVGTPGMNFLPGEITDGVVRVAGTALGPANHDTGPCRLGFRPEWARVRTAASQESSAAADSAAADSAAADSAAADSAAADSAAADNAAALSVEVSGQRILGTHRGVPFGLVEAQVGDARVVTRQPLDRLHLGPGVLEVSGFRTFREGWALDA